MEADGAELGVCGAAGEGQEGFAGEERGHVHGFFGDGQDGLVGLQV